jgi:hypothetical protein
VCGLGPSACDRTRCATATVLQDEGFHEPSVAERALQVPRSLPSPFPVPRGCVASKAGPHFDVTVSVGTVSEEGLCRRRVSRPNQSMGQAKLLLKDKVALAVGAWPDLVAVAGRRQATSSQVASTRCFFFHFKQLGRFDVGQARRPSYSLVLRNNPG